MRIYTSYFAKTKDLEALNIQPISIALYTPEWFLNPIMLKLAPPSNLLVQIKSKTKGDELSASELLELQKEYSRKYVDMVLRQHDPQQIYDLIESWSGPDKFNPHIHKDVALCCYEKPEDFCHRKLVAGWLNKYLNIGVTEFQFT